MSNREKVLRLIDDIPENKLVFVINVLESIKAYAGTVEEIEPDEWDLEMIARAEKVNDGTAVSFEEILKKDGLTYADLQDNI